MVNVLTTNRIATVRENEFYFRSGKTPEGVLYQVREFLNSCLKSVKSQGILSCVLSFALFYLDQLVTQSEVTSTKNGDLWVILVGWPVFSLFNHLQMCLHNQENEVTLDLSLSFNFPRLCKPLRYQACGNLLHRKNDLLTREVTHLLDAIMIATTVKELRSGSIDPSKKD